MSWKKYFTEVPSSKNIEKWMTDNQESGINTVRNNQSSYLFEVYAGPTNRIERYTQYELMDTDSIISAALDTLSEFCSQKEDASKAYFEFEYSAETSDAETSVLTEYLKTWTEINDFDKRLRGIVRQTLKFGDSVFVRDPETYRLIWIDPYNVERVIVNEAKGKKPEEYYVKNPDLNLQNMTFTQSGKTQSVGFMTKLPRSSQAGLVSTATPSPQDGTSVAVPAEHIIHFSLSDGLDTNWPFGTSILEKVYKVYKQKELIEDAILIYRVHRAPERRVFYVDVGHMPPHKIMGYLERVKNEINQRRIPTRNGGNNTILDATFNPMCIDLNTKIPLMDSRTLSLSEIITEYENGKENWAYSSDPITGRIIPGEIKWAGVTRKDAQVIKIVLDNGEELIVTPDHKIPVLGHGFKEAKDLLESDSLISFETKNKQISSSGNEYEMIYDHCDNEWYYTHRMVANNIQLDEMIFEDAVEKKTTVYKDWNRFNNNPPGGYSLNQNFVFTREMLQRLIELVKLNDSNKLDTIEIVNNDQIFSKMMKECNEKIKGSSGSLDNEKFTNSKLKKMYEEFNYDGWKDFKSKLEVYNHRIVSIEYLEETMDTGCLNVDNEYHTFATDSGIFIKNSLTEDFFFPQHADGRGSRVDTLPGGENLGQINDLDYFDKKLMRGLQIPTAYMSSGSSDDSGMYNDGQATRALISEFRFQNYCEQIQSLLNDTFDKEFKMYLKGSGVQIDAGLFQLTLNPSQNFAKYRQIEIDNARLSTFTTVLGIPFISRRFAMQRYLGLSEEEIIENETMWMEENPDENTDTSAQNAAGDLGALGVRPEMGGDFGMEDFDDGALDDMGGMDSAISGSENGMTPPPPADG